VVLSFGPRALFWAQCLAHNQTGTLAYSQPILAHCQPNYLATIQP
jgi:hypothetical protein